MINFLILNYLEHHYMIFTSGSAIYYVKKTFSILSLGLSDYQFLILDLEYVGIDFFVLDSKLKLLYMLERK